MTKNHPLTLVTSECPGCLKRIEVQCTIDSFGILHPWPLTSQQLVEHCNCNLWTLNAAISRSALNQSKVTTYKVIGGEDE